MFYAFLRICVFLVLASFWLEASTSTKGLSYLNEIRENAGLIKLKHNNFLEKAASSHAKYLILNQKNGHYEKRGGTAFTGQTPSDRVIRSGYPSKLVMENISVNHGSYKKSIDNLFSAIYHRFVFLDFDKDEIGIASYSTKKRRRMTSAYVYNLGSEGISKLCSQDFIMESGQYYMKEICKNKDKMLPKSLFEKKKEVIRSKNNAIVLYPYAGQKDIWPAFYNESPDPLPYHKVSGFPVSVQFNPFNYKNVHLKSFTLHDDKGKEIKDTKILQQKNDHNNLFKKLQFALMPLKRLDFSTVYTAEFKAIADGKPIQKRWAFRTTVLKEKVYKITEDRTDISVSRGENVVLYIVPSSKNNIINSYKYKGKLKVTFLDQNTLKVKVSSRSSSLDLGRRKIFFTMK